MMKRLLLFMLLVSSVSITFTAKADKVKVMLDFRHFYAPEQGNYIETMMHFGGYSMKYRKNEKGILQGKLEITQIFRIGDSIVNYKKYEILTPEVRDSIYSDFFMLKNIELCINYSAKPHPERVS